MKGRWLRPGIPAPELSPLCAEEGRGGEEGEEESGGRMLLMDKLFLSAVILSPLALAGSGQDSVSFGSLWLALRALVQGACRLSS